MPTVPVTPGRSVQVQPLDASPLRYAKSRDFIGPAIERAGDAMARAANDWDNIEAAYDQADALNLDNTYAAELAATKAEFASLKGDVPGRELKDRLDAMDKRAEELVSGARSERSKAILRRALTVRSANQKAALTGHADAEMFRFRDGALAAGQIQASNDAVAAAGTPEFATQIGTGLTRIEERGRLNGWANEVIEVEKSKFLDGVHEGVVDAMFAVPDPSVDDIMSYVEAHGEDMTPGLRNKIVERLQKPLQGREARSDADMVMGLVSDNRPAEAGKSPPLALPGGPAGAVGAELQRAGYSGAVVAGFLGNFEVEGGYGGARGDGGKAAGIAQWHPDRQANFRRVIGKPVGEASHAEQARFVVWEMSNPEKAGMTRAQRDAILAAKTPGEAAELIDKFYERSSGQHRARRKEEAEKIGGGTYVGSPREWDRSQAYANLTQIAEREGWNPERTERAREEVDRRIARDEGLLKDRQDDAYEDALEVVATKGDGFRTHMIPSDVRARMSPVQWAQLEEIEAKLTAPKPVEANSAAAIQASLMPYYEPEKFKAMNLAELVGKVTPAELEALMVKQAAMRTKPDSTSAWSPRAGIVTALNYGKKINAMDLEPAEEAAILAIMEGEAAALYEAKGKKALTEPEYQQLFRSATRSIGTRKFWGKGSIPRYQLELGNMPDTQRARLERRLRDAGLPVTDEALLRLYRLEAR